jgi:hypothetical protein
MVNKEMRIILLQEIIKNGRIVNIIIKEMTAIIDPRTINLINKKEIK